MAIAIIQVRDSDLDQGGGDGDGEKWSGSRSTWKLNVQTSLENQPVS